MISKIDTNSKNALKSGINRHSDDLNSLISGDSTGSGLSGINAANRYLQNIATMDILDIVEKNERMNEVGPEKELQHAS